MCWSVTSLSLLRWQTKAWALPTLGHHPMSTTDSATIVAIVMAES
jgi:hypothetical protein